MASGNRITPVARLVRSAHFLLILAVLVALVVLHYAEELGIPGATSPGLHFGFERHAMDRILFLLPVFYTLFVFGWVGGLVVLVLSLLLMLPRALFWSPDPRDAIFEIASVTVIAVVVCLWYRSRLQGLEERQRAAAELNTVQQELQSQARIARSTEIRLSMLNAVSGMLSNSLELKSLMSSAIGMVMEVMDVEVVLIFSVDEKSQELKPVAWEGITDGFAQEASGIALGEGFNGLVAQTGEPLLVEDASRDPRLTRQVVNEEKLKALLIVPLKTKGRTSGTLCVANRRPRKFLPEEVQLLTAISNQIAIAIDNARLYQEQQEIAAQYRGIFDNASDAIWIQDLEGNILTANEATSRLTGYDREDLLRMKVDDLLLQDGSGFARELEQRLLRVEISGEPYDRRLVRKGGGEVHLRLMSNVITRDGKPVGFQHVVRDVTKEKQIERNLRFYIEEITRAQEEERKRIARELHDETAQQIIALGHQLEDFARNSQQLLPDDIELLQGWRDSLREMLQGVRRFTRDLRPPILDDLGLVPAVEWLTDELRSALGMNVDMRVVGPERRFSPEAELVLFRIVQEAMANVRRHSEASAVEVVLEFNDDKTRVIIRDNGQGFDVPTMLGDLSRASKLGLIGMEERARLIGGTIAIQSEPSRGTTITVVVPVLISSGLQATT